HHKPFRDAMDTGYVHESTLTSGHIETSESTELSVWERLKADNCEGTIIFLLAQWVFSLYRTMKLTRTRIRESCPGANVWPWRYTATLRLRRTKRRIS